MSSGRLNRSGGGKLRCGVGGVRSWLVGLAVLDGRLRPCPVCTLAARLRLLRVARLSRTTDTSEKKRRWHAPLVAFSVDCPSNSLPSTVGSPCTRLIDRGPVELSSGHAARVIGREASVCVERILRLYRTAIIEAVGEATPPGSRKPGAGEARCRESSGEEGAREGERGQSGAPVR